MSFTIDKKNTSLRNLFNLSKVLIDSGKVGEVIKILKDPEYTQTLNGVDIRIFPPPRDILYIVHPDNDNVEILDTIDFGYSQGELVFEEDGGISYLSHPTPTAISPNFIARLMSYCLDYNNKDALVELIEYYLGDTLVDHSVYGEFYKPHKATMAKRYLNYALKNSSCYENYTVNKSSVCLLEYFSKIDTNFTTVSEGIIYSCCKDNIIEPLIYMHHLSNMGVACYLYYSKHVKMAMDLGHLRIVQYLFEDVFLRNAFIELGRSCKNQFVREYAKNMEPSTDPFYQTNVQIKEEVSEDTKEPFNYLRDPSKYRKFTMLFG